MQTGNLIDLLRAAGHLGAATKEPPIELETAPVDLDPIVMDIGDEAFDIPDGWDLLLGGVERTIGVNQDWIRDFMGRPWRIEVDGTVIARADEFHILGESRSVAVETQEPAYDCGEPTGKTEPVRAARIATSAPILIRY